jgi:signal transduction histidine kinase
MELVARDSGISVVGAIPWGTHFCHFYETSDDLLDILIPFFKTGLERNEFCMWVVSDPLPKERALAALRQEVPDIDSRVAAGRMELLSHEEWYLKDGGFEPQAVIAAWQQRLSNALANGQSGMRANGNESWLTDKDWGNFVSYEHRLNALMQGTPMIVLCTYPLAKCSGGGVFDVARAHEFAIAKRFGSWNVLESPRLKEVERELKELSEHLEERVVDRTLSLGTVNELLRRVAARVQAAAEAEGTRIASEIHDELGSALTSLRWDLELVQESIEVAENSAQLARAGERLAGMRQLTDQTVAALKRITTHLRPRVLEELGLVEAVKQQARDFEASTGIACSFESTIEHPHLSPEQCTAVFRAAQEALTNVRRHAEATKVELTMHEGNGTVILRVHDNGKGIPAPSKWRTDSLGLWAMRERAHLAGGTLDIAGSDGEGSTITLEVPTLSGS